MVNSHDFSKRLEKILDFYGISATAFSEKIDFNRSTISHLLSGRNKPSLEFVMKVVKEFPEVELYWLLNGKGYFPPRDEVSEVKTERSEVPSTKTESVKVQETSEKEQKEILANTGPNTSEIDRIVIFYKDGSFKAYKN